MLYRVTGTLLHHTSDQDCVSCVVPYPIPAFFLDADEHELTSPEEAHALACRLLAPIDFDYEAVTLTLDVKVAQPACVPSACVSNERPWARMSL